MKYLLSIYSIIVILGISSVAFAQTSSMPPASQHSIRPIDPIALQADAQGGLGLIPCDDTCNFNDIMQLINNLITFLITTLFIPIIIILFMYSGFKYITAQGNPAKIGNIKKTVIHIVVGMLLVLCSWLIVKTVLSVLVKDKQGALQFLE